jgi:hypothetical protein
MTDDVEFGAVDGKRVGKENPSTRKKETLPSAILSTTKPT